MITSSYINFLSQQSENMGWQRDRPTDRQTHRHIDKKTERQTDRGRVRAKYTKYEFFPWTWYLFSPTSSVPLSPSHCADIGFLFTTKREYELTCRLVGPVVRWSVHRSSRRFTVLILFGLWRRPTDRSNYRPTDNNFNSKDPPKRN